MAALTVPPVTASQPPVPTLPANIVQLAPNTTTLPISILPAVTNTADFLTFSDNGVAANDAAFNARILAWVNANKSAIQAVLNS